MEQFFVGLLFGVIFSAAFRLLGVLNRRAARTDRQLASYLVLEILLVASVLLALHWYWGELSGTWGKTHQWFHEYIRRPVHWFQFILGTVTGVMLRLWAVRLASTYTLTKPAAESPWLPVHGDGGDFLLKERGWMIALAGLLFLAVLLPQVESLVRSMTSLKIVGVEVAFKDQKESNRASLKPFGREKVAVDHLLEKRSFAQVKERLASDDRSYKRIGQPTHEAANRKFLDLYDTAIGPYMACMKELVDRGHEFETIRGWTRELIISWQAAADSAERDARARLSELVKKSARLIEKSGCKRAWKRDASTSSTIGPEARTAPEFYRSLAAMLQFLDNRLSAIQILEGARGKFAGHFNWHQLLALLYYDEDPTLERSLEHYEAARRIAEAILAATTMQVKKAPSPCPAAAAASRETRDLCYDQTRFQKALGVAENGVAYVLAQMADAGRLARALHLAAGQVRATRKAAETDPALRTTYLTILDTLAYAVMASEASSATPDAEAMACAEAAFRVMADEWRADLKESARRAGQPGFRTDYLSKRYAYETANLHLNTASVLLANLERGGQGATRCPRAQLQKLMEGNY